MEKIANNNFQAPETNSKLDLKEITHTDLALYFTSASLKQIAKAFGMSIEELVSENREVDSQKQRMLELWNRLEVEEKENVINIIKTILSHNK